MVLYSNMVLLEQGQYIVEKVTYIFPDLLCTVYQAFPLNLFFYLFCFSFLFIYLIFGSSRRPMCHDGILFPKNSSRDSRDLDCPCPLLGLARTKLG